MQKYNNKNTKIQILHPSKKGGANVSGLIWICDKEYLVKVILYRFHGLELDHQLENLCNPHERGQGKSFSKSIVGFDDQQCHQNGGQASKTPQKPFYLHFWSSFIQIQHISSENGIPKTFFIFWCTLMPMLVSQIQK